MHPTPASQPILPLRNYRVAYILVHLITQFDTCVLRLALDASFWAIQPWPKQPDDIRDSLGSRDGDYVADDGLIRMRLLQHAVRSIGYGLQIQKPIQNPYS